MANTKAYAFNYLDKFKAFISSINQIYKSNLLFADLSLKMKLKLCYLFKLLSSPLLQQDLLKYSGTYPEVINHMFHMLHLLSAGDADKVQMVKTQSHYIITFLEKTGTYKFALNLFPSRQTPVAHDLYPLIDTFYLKLYDYYPIDGKIVDIGGYIGDTSIYFSRKGAKTIEVFEPNPYNYKYLLLNLKLNNCFNVKPFQLAVAKDNGCSILNIPRYVSGGASLYTTSLTRGELRSSIKSQVRTISCHRVLGSHIDLLKMDCKGCEEAIILQCGEELRNNVDYLVYQSETLDKFHFNKLLDTLKGLNFDIDKVDRTYWMVYASSRR